ncbi:hypothetical protein DESA109040_05195 [Deinococcus saxicola]|uniref:hypothetical protein n=1 Tax=Deinococcus saxicola TaxID=249406 RepID=UPI0039F0B848
MWGERPVCKLRRVQLGRAATQQWGLWRHSGTVLMGVYLAAFALIGLYSLWQSYRFPLPVIPPELFAALAAVWWLSAGLIRSPALGLGVQDALLLRIPAPPWAVLTVPLVGMLGWPVLQGLGLGALLAAWFVPLWPLALALPLLAAGRPLFQTLFHDSGLISDSRRQTLALLLAFLPLLALWNLAVLPLACLLAFVGWLALWRGLWLETVHAAPVLHARVQGWRQGARRLGLPVPEVGADGTPAPRRWLERRIGPPRGSGPLAALCQRGLLSLARQPWRVVAAVAVGLGVGAGSPVVLALMLGPLLAVLAPPLPPHFPVKASTARLFRTLPAGVFLGLGLSIGCGVAVALGLTPAVSLLAAPLIPWAALCCLGFLGTAAPGGQATDSGLRFGAAMAPAMGVFVCALFGVLWLAPLVLLLLGGAALAAG